jgi:hypothetical protein
MKRYIKASFDSSMPDWLRNALRNDISYINSALRMRKVALDKLVVYDDTIGNNSTPVYKLIDDDGNINVYIPGINDNMEIHINGRNRSFGKISRKTLESLADDIVYINLSDPNIKFEVREKYKDPRINSFGYYGGQYKHDDNWVVMQPRYMERQRDKSGYEIPSPSDKLRNLYRRYPEKITEKLDAMYDEIIDTQSLLQSFEFKNSPEDYYSQSNAYSTAYTNFGKAVDLYRTFLNDMRSAGDFSNTDDFVMNRIYNTMKEIRKYLKLLPN